MFLEPRPNTLRHPPCVTAIRSTRPARHLPSPILCKARPVRAPKKVQPTEGTVPSSPSLEQKLLDQCRTLVLDVSMRPVDVVCWKRAICMDLFDKVDVLEYYNHVCATSPNDMHPVPAVLKVRVYVKHNQEGSIRASRRNVFIRDKYTCMYCGSRSKLTVDHVVPVCKGGRWEWPNLTTACAPCNTRKGGRSLSQLQGMTLRRPPQPPCPSEAGLIAIIQSLASGTVKGGDAPPEWSAYLTQLDARSTLKAVVADMVEQHAMQEAGR